MSSFQVKVVGDFCNIRCTYCRNRDFDQDTCVVMKVGTLEQVLDFLTSLPQKRIRTHWHGGEPLLAGKEFFDHIVRLQKAHPGISWANAVQTNAILIDDEWASFFRRHDFHVGVSVDGSKRTHNINRVNRAGSGTFSQVMDGVEVLRRNGVTLSVICTVTSKTAEYAEEMLCGLVDAGFKDIAFNVFYNTASRTGDDPHALTAAQWLSCLIELFESWLELNDAAVRVRELDGMLAWTRSKTANLCSYRGLCHQWFVVDYTGELYPCERFGRSMCFGRVDSLASFQELFASPPFLDWKTSISTLPRRCQSCGLQPLCHNGCVAHTASDSQGVPLYVYCESRIGFYRYVCSRLEGKERTDDATETGYVNPVAR
jgi:uncharacterized protein